MAKTNKKRRRKRRGTQGGGISTRPAARPRNRQEARARARQRQASPKSKGSKGSKGGKGAAAGLRGVPSPPSWRSAIGKGALAAVLFFGLFAGLFHRPIASSAALAAFTLAFYVPLSYYLDGFMYRRHQAKSQREHEQAKQPKQGGDDG